MQQKLKLVIYRGLVLAFGFVLNFFALKTVLDHHGIEPLNLLLIIWSLFPLYNLLDLGSSINIMNNLGSVKLVFIRAVSKSLQLIVVVSLFSFSITFLGVQFLNSQGFDFAMNRSLQILAVALWVHSSISLLNILARTLNALDEVIWSTLISSLLGPVTSILTISFVLLRLKFEFLLFGGAIAGLVLSTLAFYLLSKHIDLKILKSNLLDLSNIVTNINLVYFGLNFLILINSVLPRLILIKSFSATQAVIGNIIFQVLYSGISLGASAVSRIWRDIILRRDRPNEMLAYVRHEINRMQTVALATSGLVLTTSLVSLRFLRFEVTGSIIFTVILVAFVSFIVIRNQAYGAYSNDAYGLKFQIKLQSAAVSIFCILLFTGITLNFLTYFMIWATVNVAFIQLPLWLRFRIMKSRL
jgi:hypothetical protein